MACQKMYIELLYMHAIYCYDKWRLISLPSLVNMLFGLGQALILNWASAASLSY